MVDTPRQLKEQDDVLSSLNMAVDALNHAKEATSIRSVKAAFTSTNVLLTAIKVGFFPLHVGRSLANVLRTWRSPGWNMLNWGWPALTSAETLTGGWTKGERTSSVKLSSGQLES